MDDRATLQTFTPVAYAGFYIVTAVLFFVITIMRRCDTGIFVSK